MVKKKRGINNQEVGKKKEGKNPDEDKLKNPTRKENKEEEQENQEEEDDSPNLGDHDVGKEKPKSDSAGGDDDSHKEKEFSKIEKPKSDSAGGGDDPLNLGAGPPSPPLIVKGFNIKESKHVYNGVVTIGYPNDHQLKNVEDFESLGVLRRSFIPCHNRQQDHLEHIESLGECNSNFLFPKEVVNCEVEVGTVRKFIVAEEMVTVEEYFADQLQKYLKSKEWEVETFVKMSKNDRLDILRDWWKHISSKFISIFRELIHACLYHYHTFKKPIGHLDETVFVTKRHSKVRVLPSMDDLSTFDADISTLNKMMRKSVRPAFLKEVEVDAEQIVSVALRRFFELVSKTKGSIFRFGIISVCWIIDHPFIWSSMDRIKFIKKMHRICKIQHALRTIVDIKLEKQFAQVHWKEKVEHPVLLKILKKPLQPDSSIKHYKDYVDILRFHNAVYSHYNEKEYKNLRPKVPEDLDEDEIDAILSREFPLLCVWVKTIVLNYLTIDFTKAPSRKDRQILEELLSFK